MTASQRPRARDSSTRDMLVAALTMKSPLYEGPIAAALGGMDLSWLLGFPVAALL